MAARSWFYTLAALLYCSSAEIHAATELCGVIDVPTSLTKARSPYLITGDLYVTSSARLTIEEGALVLIGRGDKCQETRQLDWADSQWVSIKVDGLLFILGSPEDPVIMRPADTATQGTQWYGIRVRNRDWGTAQVQYLHMYGAHRGIHALTSTFSVANSLFADGNTGIWLEDEANLNIYNCVFQGNSSTGIYLKNNLPWIAANIFVDNMAHGIWSDSRPSLKVVDNLFWNNADSDCLRCPSPFGKRNATNANGDSADALGNLFQDPVFAGTLSERQRMSKDPMVPTQAQEVRDTSMYRIYAEAAASGKTGLRSPAAYPSPKGACWPSKYSPARDAAPESEFFQDQDGSRGDLGLYGGKPGRATHKVKQ